jgi:site-specific recombinase XerC
VCDTLATVTDDGIRDTRSAGWGQPRGHGIGSTHTSLFEPVEVADSVDLCPALGNRLAPDVLSRMVTAYIRAGASTQQGNSHLFCHSAATLMLDAGADVRYVAEMLGHQKLETTMTYTRV